MKSIKVYFDFEEESLRLIRGEQLLKLRFVILVKSFKVLNLILMGFLVPLSILLILLDNVNDFLIKPFDLIFELIVSCS